jgi:hypothetical protein
MAGQDLAKTSGPELRPAPVFAVGVTGHRRIGVEGEAAIAVETSLATLLGNLSVAFKATIASAPEYFANRAPVMRVVTMAAEGADLLGARAGRGVTAEINLILPYDRVEYRKDFTTPVAITLFDTTLASATTVLELPGTREEGPRAYERANEFILSHVDLLIAVWDGSRANGRGGTGDIVQDAISARIPVVVVDPRGQSKPQLLLHPGTREFDPPVATDLSRRALPDDLRELTNDVLLPSRTAQQHPGYPNLVAEPAPAFRLWHFEYRWLMKAFLVFFKPRPSRLVHDRWEAAVRFAQTIDSAYAERLIVASEVSQQIDALATRYGDIYRSSTVTRYFVAVVVTLAAATVSIAFPGASYISYAGTFVVNVILLIDGIGGTHGRWQERWIDYRWIAEQLRSLRFLHMLGVAKQESAGPFLFTHKSWASWYVQRVTIALGGLNGVMRPPDERASDLLNAHIAEQIEYHHNAYRARSALERGLGNLATAAICLAMLIGLVAFLLNHYSSPASCHDATCANAIPARIGIAINALISWLLVVMTSLRGYRADADLIRLTERSAMTAVALSSLKRTLTLAPLTLDRIRIAASHIVTITSGELTEWRFVLESRSTRTLHRGAKTPVQKLARFWRRLRG